MKITVQFESLGEFIRAMGPRKSVDVGPVVRAQGGHQFVGETPLRGSKAVSTRVRNALIAHGYDTLESVMNASDRDLMKVSEFGKGALTEVQELRIRALPDSKDS